MSKNDPPTGASAQIVTGLLKLSLVLRHEAWQASGQRGLTPTQSQILALMASLGAISVSTVARQLSITKGTASQAVSTLERKELLRKDADSSDGRAVALKLTRKGRREAQRSAQWPNVVVAAAHSIPSGDQGAFLRGLTALIRSLQEQDAVPTSRMCAQCRFFRPNLYPGQEKTHHCAYIKAPIADVDLRIDCGEMEPADAELQPLLTEALLGGTSIDPSLLEGEGPSR